MIGKEQTIVSKMVNRTLKKSVVTAGSLDMIKYFKKLAAKRSLKGVQGTDFIRKARVARWKPYAVPLLENIKESNFFFLLST
ncbi:hypothetical protein HF650_24025 [Kosakonia sp. SMBL-WEM22]|uniref:hypothetical protein n=1 Tax=Kosakonia sp. SMBL-WEM22 TaxID=2725560 RepID=UPI00165973B8|nr:hypothetical protein [Kosakonia sp. SMBL-WEM22]MDV5354429.1 hypothetical protein [Enterobacter asburiae]QNQ18294.1 hypothetical protein HF650_24025 [Kosakonia sp. SMBL-WEM22]